VIAAARKLKGSFWIRFPIGTVWRIKSPLENAIPSTALSATSVLRKNEEDVLQNVSIQSYR
jgi:hypothetical protein